MVKKIFRFSRRIFNGVYRRFYKYFVKIQLKQTGVQLICDINVLVYGGENITIGNNVVLNRGVLLQSCEGATIKIGNNVTLSYDVKLLTGNLNYTSDRLSKLERHSVNSIYLNDNVWIGAGSIVLPGVSIANNVVVAAGSIVTKSIETANALYGGNPAKFIKLI